MSDLNGAPEGAAEHLPMSDGGQEAPRETFNPRDDVARAFEQLEKEQPPAEGQKPLTPDARARDEQGRFARGEQPQPKPGEPQPEPQKEGQPEPDKQPAKIGPPPGWSPASKDAFASLPDSVKADIAKREQEVNAGLSELREYRDLRPYRDMAQRSGTDLPNVLAQLTKMEDMLGRDPINAIGALSEMYKFDIRQTVSGLAKALGMEVGQGAQPQEGQSAAQQQMQLPPEIMDRLSRFDQLERHIQGQETSRMTAAVQSFADDPANEFFENVGAEIQQIIASDLNRYRSMPPHMAVKEAYDKAVWMNPETRDVLIKRQSEAAGRATAEKMKAQADQARQAAKGLSGTPVNGATPGSTPPTPKSTRDAVAMAFEQHSDI